MSYWEAISKARYSRRVALKLSAAGASLAALVLAGCGSSGSKSASSGSAAKGLVADPGDATAKATAGGILALSLPADVTSFDAIGGNTGVSFTQGLHAYSRLMKYVPGKFPKSPDGAFEGDAAVSWEPNGDGTEYTFKLRPNHKFDPRPPTNGRAMTSADIKYAWERFASVSQQRTDLANAVNPAAPVVSVTTPDAMSVTFKLAYPSAPFLTNLSYYRYFNLMPPESDQFNFRAEMRGTGPWRLESYQGSVKVSYKKNPDWYDAASVKLDGIDYYIVPEYATGLAQFRAGNLWYYSAQKEDILPTKRGAPELILQSSGVFSRTLSPWMSGGALPGSVFQDDRVRRALSMLIDRETFVDIFSNVSNFRKEGLDVPTRWATHIPVGINKYWLDPKGKELGEGAANFQFNAAEAKKLLLASGQKLPIETTLHWTNNGYAAPYPEQVNAFQGMFEANRDFKFTQKAHDYATDWTPNFHQGYGKWEGLAIGTMSTQPDIDGTLFEVYRSGSVKKHNGFDDPKVDSLVDSQRRELNDTKRTELIKELERYLATKMYSIHAIGEGLTFTLAQPWYGNYGVYKFFDAGSVATEEYTHAWYDASKKKV